MLHCLASGCFLNFAVLIFLVPDLLLHVLDFDPFLADVEPKMRVNTHVLVGYPDQSKAADEISTPVLIKQLETGDDEKKCGHIVAEAVLAGEDEEEFAPQEAGILFALADAVVSSFSADLFVGDGPGDGGNGKGQQKQPEDLQ